MREYFFAMKDIFPSFSLSTALLSVYTKVYENGDVFSDRGCSPGRDPDEQDADYRYIRRQVGLFRSCREFCGGCAEIMEKRYLFCFSGSVQ